MKEVKVELVNRGMNFGRKNDLEKAERTINDLLAEGWSLDHVVSPNDVGGAIVGIFSREKEDKAE